MRGTTKIAGNEKADQSVMHYNGLLRTIDAPVVLILTVTGTNLYMEMDSNKETPLTRHNSLARLLAGLLGSLI